MPRRAVQATTALQWQALFSRSTSQVQITIPVLIICNILAHDFTSRHAFLALTIPTLLGFLQIHGHPSPFQVHPMITRASVISVLGYYLSFRAKLWLPITYASRLGFAMSVLGSFSVASLGSLLLPHSLWPFRYIFYVILMVSDHPSLRKIYDSYLWRLLHRQQVRMRAAQPRLLPQTYLDLAGLRR